MSVDERRKALKEKLNLSDEDLAVLDTGIPLDITNRMVENVIGNFAIPFGIGTNFIINGKEYMIPMAVEETSVIAAASNAAKLACAGGGFTAESDEPVMIGQIQLFGVEYEKTRKILTDKIEEMKGILNRKDSTLVSLGGGFKDIEVRPIDNYTVIHLLVDVRDAMGANVVNTMCECISPYIEQWTGGKTGLRIISNLADYRMVRASATWSKTDLEKSFDGKVKGEEVVNAIISAWKFAADDIYRCATHNKGIMNGIDAIMIATGNDWRAVEAGAHTYSRITEKPLTWYEKDKEGNLIGHIEIPMVVGIVGGSVGINPFAQFSLKVLGVKSSRELGEVAACVGLANNFAALRALSVEGLQRGHMKLHATNIAQMAGAVGEEIDKIASQMVEEKKISVARAKELLNEIKK